MNMRIIKTLYKKEILDVLRDKKTVIMMLVVPIVLYPLLIIAGLGIVSGVSNSLSEHIYNVAVIGDDALARELRGYDLEEKYSLKLVEVEDVDKALSDEEIDAYIEASGTGEKLSLKIRYISSVTNSNYAAGLVSDLLKSYSEDKTESMLKTLGLDSDAIMEPVKIEFADASTNEETAGSLMASILPFMLVVSLLMGTMYPAIDTTAGERERGTLETLLTLPVSNTEIIVSKFLVVATIGVISSILNIISLGGVGIYMYKMASSYMQTSGGISMGKFAPAIIICILCILAFAIFISAASMCVTAFAKSYKEANNYITPLALVVMFASFVGFIPNIKLSNTMALAPVANICLLIRDMLTFKFDAGAVLLVLVSNVLYGILAIMFLGRIYNSEAILFGESAAGVQIFERRKNIKSGEVPELGDVVLVIAVTLVAMIYIGGAIQSALGYYGTLGTQLIVLLIPLGAAVYTKKDLRETFRLKKCGIRYVIGGLLMIIGAIIVGVMLSAILGLIFPESTREASELQASLVGDSFFAMLFMVALVPAICEELMFRGYVLSAFEKRFKPTAAMLITACLFGLFHLSIVRFIVTAFLGYVLCYVAHKSRSIIPGMLMHFTNNAISCISLYYPDIYSKVIIRVAGHVDSFLDLLILVAFGVCFLYAGVMVINLKSNNIDKFE